MKLLFTPPLRTDAAQWKARLADLKLGYNIVLAGNDEAVKAELPDTDAVFGWVSPDCLPFAKRLRWLQSPQAGPTRGFYYDELVAHPVVICNPRGVYNDHIAQHIMMYVLALSRGLPAYLEAQRHSRWERDAPSTRYVDLSQASALIVGVGGIGQETSLRCQAFGMTVHGIDERWEYETPGLLRHNARELREVAAEVDFVIATVPQTPATEGLFNRDVFTAMRSDAFFINIGRGATTRLTDLSAAIADGEIAGCALDVYETEPLSSEHTLWTMDNVILTPHVAVAGAENIDERWFEVLTENAKRFAASEPLMNVVNKAMWY